MMPLRPKQVLTWTYEQKKEMLQCHEPNAALTHSQLVDKAKREIQSLEGAISGDDIRHSAWMSEVPSRDGLRSL